MIARLVTIYVAIFATVLLALSVIAYLFVGTQYHSLLLPALATPEGAATYATAMRRVALTIVAFDIPLVILVGIASWLLARVAIAPLLEAQARERLFIADAAHALRSPLATIASVAQATKCDDGAARDAFTLITATSLEAGNLVSDLLTLARAPRPSLLTREPLDLAALVRTCVREFETRAAGAGLRLDVEVQPAIVSGDARRLRELLRNLLDNALRYARRTITVRCSVSNGIVRLVIGDDGSGIDPSVRGRIFERFARDERGRGNGLGLSIAHWVVTAHGGTIVVEEGDETSFIVELPEMPPA